MRLGLTVVAGLVGLVLLAVGGLWLYFTFIYEEPQYIADHGAVLAGVTVQPARAIELARPHLGEATVVHRQDLPLALHVVRYKDHYHVMQTNYPAKTAGWYLRPAVTVHVQTGEVRVVRKGD